MQYDEGTKGRKKKKETTDEWKRLRKTRIGIYAI